MHFEILKRKNKKFIMGIIILIIIGLAILFNASLAKYQVTESISLVKGTINYSPYDVSVIVKLFVGDNQNIELDSLPETEDLALISTTCTNNATLSWNSAKNGYEITNLTNKGTKCSALYAVRDSFTEVFDYTKNIVEYKVPKTGNYLLEVWGAEGGSGTNSYGTRIGGLGGYAKGLVSLEADTSLFVVVGGRGVDGTSTSTQTGGYNGGGSGIYHGGSGGGATHIATSTGLLSSLSSNKDAVLIVAGGGGGGAVTNDGNCSDGGNGGGISGTDSIVNACYGTIGEPYNGYGTGGTQTSGGTQSANNSSHLGSGGTGSFGIGATTTLNNNAYGAGGGGGGYYGGGSSTLAGAGGGSGYIGNSKLISADYVTKSMYCYNCETSSDSDTLTYSISSTSSTAVEGTPKTGNGYAKITYIGYSAYKPEFEMSANKADNSITITITPSSTNFFETSKYYYSIGEEFIESTYNSYTFNNLIDSEYSVKAYIVDLQNITSDIKVVEGVE